MRPLRLLADIGGTSSRWAWSPALDGSASFVYDGELPGLNPLHGDVAAFQAALRTRLLQQHAELDAAEHVQLYGAGCGDVARADRLRQAIAPLFPKAFVEVESDLLGAARSLFGEGQGLVLIVGTGMNAGYFANGGLHLPMPSLGYLLGDEGSGADIGRHFLRELLYGTVPDKVVQQIYGEERPTVAGTLARIHGAPSPARELAMVVQRLTQVRDHPWVHALLLSRFTALVERLQGAFRAEELREARASGSVAAAFRVELEEALARAQIGLTEVVWDPMPGLVRHHFGPPAR
ncbi:MAG: hypothetical protein JNM31_04955 [Flavobacteriales bacterium]|nr:hypothetical protein [Flavobacteriales bacterium]